MISLSKLSSAKKNGKYWLLADQLLVSGSSLLTLILAARGLTAVKFGCLSFIILIQLLLLTLQNALITSPYIVLQAGPANVKGYISSLLLILLAILLLFGLAGFAVMQSGYFGVYPFAVALAGAFPMIAGFLVQDFIRRVFLTEKKEYRAFIIDALTNLPQLAILYLLFSSGHLTLTRCVTVMGLTFIPSILVGLWWLSPCIPARITILLTLQLHLRDGRWLLATSLLQWWAGNSLTLACGLLLGVAAFGALRLAQTIFGFVNVLLQAFENYVLPISAGLYQQTPSDLPGYLRRISVKAGFAVLPCLLGITLLAKPLFRLAGGKPYVSYYPLLQELSLLYLFIFAGYPLRIAIRVLRLNKAFFMAYLLASLFCLLAAGPLIRHWGPKGVIAGLLINQFILLSYWSFILYKNKFYGNHTYRPRES